MNKANEVLLDGLIELVAENGEPPLEAAKRMVQEARRYRWLKAQAIEGDWGHHFGWKLHIDIKGAPSLETLDQAIDAAVIEGND